MSEPWADYVAVLKQMNHSRTHIARIWCIRDHGTYLGVVLLPFTRREVLDEMRDGFKFVTATFDRDADTWKYGAKIIRCRENGTIYIKTEPDGIEEDNLDELPEFNGSGTPEMSLFY